MLLIKEHPGAWASWHSLEKDELLEPKIVKTVEDAHAVTWVVFEQFLRQIKELDGDDNATKSRLIAEENR